MCITGLGNPEPAYANTRHNAGLTMLDMLKDELAPGKPFVSSKTNKLVKYVQKDTLVMLRSDGNYINLSGENVVKLWNKLGKNVLHIVVHDELSLPLGKVQLRTPGASVRGHNGLKSIVQYCGSDFYRLAIGIGRPLQRDSHSVAEYVLERFTPQDLDILRQESFGKASKLVNNLLK